MAEQFVIADPHFSQLSMATFAGKDGRPLRPWGRVDRDMNPQERERRVAEMDEAMIERWNAVVPATGAKVYVLGDVVMKKAALPILARLNGKKKLIKGNHDILKLKDYAPYFYDIGAYRIMDGLIMSHIPIHEESLKERWSANVHGHLHDGRVMMPSLAPDLESVLNPRYLCVSVEHTDYAPISMDEVRKRIADQQGL